VTKNPPLPDFDISAQKVPAAIDLWYT